MQQDAGPYLTTFVFVGNRYVLVGKDESVDGSTESAALYLVDLTTQSNRWKFCMPSLVLADAVQALELLSEPGAMWEPSPAEDAPFYVSRDDRMIILKMSVSPFSTVSFAFISSSILAFAHKIGPSGEGFKEIVWSEWGHQHCHAELSAQWDGIWPCVVYGTKYVYRRLISNGGQNFYGALVVEDYNQAMIRIMLNKADKEATSSRSELYTSETTLQTNSNRIGMDAFAKPITTSLPYRQLVVPINLSYRDYIMISEDSIVIVKVLVCRH